MIKRPFLHSILLLATTAIAQDPGEPAVLTVDSTGARGVRIELTAPDRVGRRGGDTFFVRSYRPGDPYQLTAPRILTGSRPWVFNRWNRRIGSGASTAMPQGEVSISSSSISNTHAAVADYLPGVHIRIRATGIANPWSHIRVDVPDVFGTTFGTTPLDLYYPTTTGPVTVRSVNPRRFREWQVDGVPQTLLDRFVTVDTSNQRRVDLTLIHAEYASGSATTMGRGCDGPNGERIQLYTIDDPRVGDRMVVRLRQAFPSAPAVLLFGLDATNLGGLPLPITIPGSDVCQLRIAPQFSIPRQIGPGGFSSLPLEVPLDTAWSGVTFYLQYLMADPAGVLPGVRASNGLEIVIAGPLD